LTGLTTTSKPSDKTSDTNHKQRGRHFNFVMPHHPATIKHKVCTRSRYRLGCLVFQHRKDDWIRSSSLSHATGNNPSLIEHVTDTNTSRKPHESATWTHVRSHNIRLCVRPTCYTPLKCTTQLGTISSNRWFEVVVKGKDFSMQPSLPSALKQQSNWTEIALYRDTISLLHLAGLTPQFTMCA
jgi:hypothetical protein